MVLLSCYTVSLLVVYCVPGCPVNLCPIIRPIVFVAWSHRTREGFVNLVRTVPKMAGG
jgi:hypothetical protein